MSYKIFGDAEILYSEDLNARLSSILLDGQTIDSGVVLGDLVYYDVDAEEWIVSASYTPQGICVGNDIVLVSGLVVNLSGLTPGNYYWMNSSGKITSDSGSAFNGTRIGYAKSATELVFKINTTGDNEPVEKTVVTGETGTFAGLRAYYGFEEPDGQFVYDIRNGPMGDITYNHNMFPQRPVGIVGQSGYNNGDFVGVSDNNVNIVGDDPRTMSAWVYFTGTWSFQGALLGWGGTGTTNASCYFRVTSGNNFQVQFWGNTLSGAGSYNSSQWYHLVLTYDGTTARFYIDGSEVDDSVISLNTNNGPLILHGYATGTGISNGRLDEIAIFDRALSAGEVSTLYNTGSATVYDPDVDEEFIRYEFKSTVSAKDLNENLYNIKLLDQPFETVNINPISPKQLVNTLRYPQEGNLWVVSSEATPAGLFAGEGVVYLKGIIPLGLVPGHYYYMTEDGLITSDIVDAFNKTKIGYSITDHLFLLDIETVGTNTPISPGFVDLVFTTTPSERQFAGMVEGVDYEVNGNTLRLNPNYHYKFSNVTLGPGTTLTLRSATVNNDSSVLAIECENDFESEATIVLNNLLHVGRFPGSGISINGINFFRPLGGLGGASNDYGMTGSGHGNGGRGSNASVGTNPMDGTNVSASGGSGGFGGWAEEHIGSVGDGGTALFNGPKNCGSWPPACLNYANHDSWGWARSWGGGGGIARGGGGAAVMSYTSISSGIEDIWVYGGQTGGSYGQQGGDGEIIPWPLSGWTTNMKVEAGGGGGNGGMSGRPGCHLYVRANNITLAGSVNCSGTNGGNGGDGGRKRRAEGHSQIVSGGSFTGSGGYGGSGGGGGSSGNVRLEYYTSVTNVASITVNKGVGGTGGFRASGSGWSSEKQDDGMDGNNGSVIETQVS